MTEQESSAKRIVKAARAAVAGERWALADDMPARPETSTSDLTGRLLRAVEVALHHTDYGLQERDTRAAVVAVLRVLAEVAPGTPEYAVEFDFAGLADEIEKQ